jgi:hypothetical protein
MLVKRIAGVVLTLAAVAAALWCADVLSDRRYRLAVISPAPLYSLRPDDYPPSNPLVTTLAPGTPVQVLRMGYGKDFQTFRVETSAGEVGWVVRGEGVEVVSDGSS